VPTRSEAANESSSAELELVARIDRVRKGHGQLSEMLRTCSVGAANTKGLSDAVEEEGYARQTATIHC
jgi:hypothetical protein